MSIGIWQLVLILLIVFVIFGAGKLPRVMGDIGKGVRSLKSGLKGEGDSENEANPAPDVITSQHSEVQTESDAKKHEQQSQ